MRIIKDAVIASTSTLLVYVNDTYLAPSLIEKNRELVCIARDLDHFLAGISVPYLSVLIWDIIGAFSGEVAIKYTEKYFIASLLGYGAFAISWETKQAFERGYFQFDQFVCDMAGVATAYAIDKLILNRNHR